MDQRTRDLHLGAGRIYGRESTCGTKVDYTGEVSAIRAAAAMTAKRTDGKQLEAYPCYWCNGWHVGRAMTEEEVIDMRVKLGLQP